MLDSVCFRTFMPGWTGSPLSRQDLDNPKTFDSASHFLPFPKFPHFRRAGCTSELRLQPGDALHSEAAVPVAGWRRRAGLPSGRGWRSPEVGEYRSSCSVWCFVGFLLCFGLFCTEESNCMESRHVDGWYLYFWGNFVYPKLTLRLRLMIRFSGDCWTWQYVKKKIQNKVVFH